MSSSKGKWFAFFGFKLLEAATFLLLCSLLRQGYPPEQAVKKLLRDFGTAAWMSAAVIPEDR